MMTAIEATQPAEPAAPCESLQPPPPLCVMEPVINASCVPTCPSSGDIDDLGNPSTSVYNGDLWSMDPTPTPTIDGSLSSPLSLDCPVASIDDAHSRLAKSIDCLTLSLLSSPCATLI